MSKNTNLLIMDDFFRNPVFGVTRHKANIDWISDLLRASLKDEDISIFTIDEILSKKEITFEYIAQSIDQNSWIEIYAQTLTPKMQKLLDLLLEGFDLVYGFELPNFLIQYLDNRKIKFLDLGISPLRFADNLGFDLRTNVETLIQSPLFSENKTYLQLAAMTKTGFFSRHSEREPDIGQTGVIFGQIPLDSSLISQRGAEVFHNYIEEIKNWAQDLDRVLFRPHPYSDNIENYNFLKTILSNIQPTLSNSYYLLSISKITQFLTLSSGIAEEAPYFGKVVHRLHKPLRICSQFPLTRYIGGEIFLPDFIYSVLNNQPIEKTPNEAFDLRTQLRIGWGLDDIQASLDYQTPPLAVGRQFIPYHQTKPNFNHQPAVLTHQINKLKKTMEILQTQEIYRFKNIFFRLISFPKNLIRKIRHHSVSQTNNMTVKKSEPTLPVIKPKTPAITSKSSMVFSKPIDPVHKNFAYASGERQTAPSLGDIRHDHLARYSLADQIIPLQTTVLDIFCGNGYGSYILANNRHVIGIDGSDEAIEIANMHFSRATGTQFIASIYPCPLPINEIDAIVCFESIEHVPDGSTLLQQLCETLKPGGLILFSTPCQEQLPFDSNQHIHHVKHFTIEEINQMIKDNQLDVIGKYGQDTYELDEKGQQKALLDQSKMELIKDYTGQFVVIVARKP